jgi:hypothetical protein
MGHVPYLPELPEGTKRSIEHARRRAGYTTKADYLRDRLIGAVADDLGISEREVIDGRVGAFAGADDDDDDRGDGDGDGDGDGAGTSRTEGGP